MQQACCDKDAAEPALRRALLCQTKPCSTSSPLPCAGCSDPNVWLLLSSAFLGVGQITEAQWAAEEGQKAANEAIYFPPEQVGHLR
jgi:hypothetical protein